MDNIRIPIKVGKSQNITFKLEQDFDNLDVLSLQVSAYDVYSQMTSDFGVVIGRVSVNGGFGVQNAKVSIFIPVSTEDESRPEIMQLYPFKSIGGRLSNNVRYNIFPRIKQGTGSHQPIGIFPDVTDLTYYPTFLEVYEKYYKFTTTTNDSGDYIIFGIPLGAQYVHMDFDMFDTKSFLLTADDLVTEITTSAGISAQLSTELTQALNPDFTLAPNGEYQVKVKADIDSMPNIFSENKLVEVIPFWGNPDVREIGITRCDFAIDYQYTPTAIFFGSLINNPPYGGVITEQYSVENPDFGFDVCNPAKDLKIVAYKHLNDSYTVERFALFDAVPSTGTTGDGVFILSLPMYEDYYVTNEFGELVKSNTTNENGIPNGVPTTGHYAFEIFDDNEGATGNGRRSVQVNDDLENTFTNMTAGIRVPATRNGWVYGSGWDINNREKTLFKYDILKGTPRFYTTEIRYRKHRQGDLRSSGDKLEYIPQNIGNIDFKFPIVLGDNNTAPDGDIRLRGSLIAPRFRILEFRERNSLRYASEMTWTPWKSKIDTSNYVTKIWDWIYGIGVRDLEGINTTEIFRDLYPNQTITEGRTWFFGDNPYNADDPPVANFYAQLLAGKPEAINRHINQIHYCYNLAVDDMYTSGLFISSVEFGYDKILYEVSIVDVTDVLDDLIQDSVYTSYDSADDHKYDGYYYLFGTNVTDNNALYKLQERYFNV